MLACAKTVGKCSILKSSYTAWPEKLWKLCESWVTVIGELKKNNRTTPGCKVRVFPHERYDWNPRYCGTERLCCYKKTTNPREKLFNLPGSRRLNSLTMNLFFADDMRIFRDDRIHTEKDSGSREHETSFSHMDGACREFCGRTPPSSVQVLGGKLKMQHWM